LHYGNFSRALTQLPQAPSLYREIGLGEGNLPKLLAACNGTEYLMAAFIPIFIIEKVGRRPLMLFGVIRKFKLRYNVG
jgi:hypothetical protein